MVRRGVPPASCPGDHLAEFRGSGRVGLAGQRYQRTVPHRQLPLPGACSPYFPACPYLRLSQGLRRRLAMGRRRQNHPGIRAARQRRRAARVRRAAGGAPRSAFRGLGVSARNPAPPSRSPGRAHSGHRHEDPVTWRRDRNRARPGSWSTAENQLPETHCLEHDGPHGSVSAAAYPQSTCCAIELGA